MIDFNNLTTKQSNRLGDSRIAKPVPLSEADLDNRDGWVYSREFGVFPVYLAGTHATISSNILAWKLGFDSLRDMPYEIIQDICGFRGYDLSTMQDKLLMNYEGVAMLPSLSPKVHIANEDSLNTEEYRAFRRFGFQYLGKLK